MGHSVRIIPAHFVKPYVKSNKNDTIDAKNSQMRSPCPCPIKLHGKLQNAAVVGGQFKHSRGLPVVCVLSL